MAGNFNKRIQNTTISVNDFYNPYNFYSVLNLCDREFYQWLSGTGLVGNADNFLCPRCSSVCKLSYRSNKRVCYTFRCVSNKNHEFSILKNSFFERSHIDVRDILVFLRSYLFGLPLRQCASESGISYGSAALDWANFVKDVFVEVVMREYNLSKLEGEVEIDEYLFGTKVKYNQNNPKGEQIWIFGLVQRDTNRLRLVPVVSRDEETILGLIKKFVKLGSTIYSDGQASCVNLNAHGYKHFKVIHKAGFKQVYKSTETGRTVEAHSNQNEGAWSHAKSRFRKIHGSKASNFENHLCEMLWRNWRTYTNVFASFVQDLRSIYTYCASPCFTAKRPVFSEWIEQNDYAETSVNISMNKASQSQVSPKSTEQAVDECPLSMCDQTEISSVTQPPVTPFTVTVTSSSKSSKMRAPIHRLSQSAARKRKRGTLSLPVRSAPLKEMYSTQMESDSEDEFE